MSNRSLFWTAVVLTTALSACRGGVSPIPPGSGFAPASDASSIGDASNAKKIVTIAVFAPLPSTAKGLSGFVYPQGTRTGPLAAFTMNIGPKGNCVESKLGERFCRKKIRVARGGPYDLLVALHRTFPVLPNARALAAASVGFFVDKKGAEEISFATAGALARPRALLSERRIHSFDPTTLFATVSGLDRFGNVLIAKTFIDAAGHPKNIALSSTLSTQILTFRPRRFGGSTTDDAIVTYHPDAAPADLVHDGARVIVTAKIKHSPNAKDGSVKLRILAPKVANAALSNSGAQPGAIALGPDGALWFCEFATGQIGRITTDMQITGEFGAFPHPQSIASAGGALWVAQNDGSGNVDRIAAPGGGTSVFPLPINTYPNGISAGTNGQLWFGSVQNNYVATISTSGTYGPQYALPTANSYPLFSTLGPDGNQYFVLNGTGQILKIAQSGTILSIFNEPGANRSPQDITSGPDGQLWFADSNQNTIYSMSTGGSFKKFQLPPTISSDGPLAFGPDGKLWYASQNGLGRLDIQNGSAIAFGVVPGGDAFGIVLAPNGAFYITENGTGQISRLQ